VLVTRGRQLVFPHIHVACLSYTVESGVLDDASDEDARLHRPGAARYSPDA